MARRIRAEEIGVFYQCSCFKNTREHLVCDAKPWITFPVFQKNIVLWLVLFYEVVFKNKRLDLGVRDYVLKPFNLRNKHLHLDAVVVLAVEIAQHSTFENFRLADVDYLVVFVVVNITPRKARQKIQRLFKALVHKSIIAHKSGKIERAI